jgi:hypothetical protein
MEQIAAAITSNVYLQAFAIVTTVAGALLFLWKNRGSIRSFIVAILYFIAGKIWIPVGTTAEQIDMGVQNSSFLVAVLFKHSVTVFLCVVGWYLCRETSQGLGEIDPRTSLIDGMQIGFVFLLNVFALVCGARLAEISVISKGVMRRIKALDVEK